MRGPEETDINKKQTNASSSFEVQYLCTIFVSQLCVRFFFVFFLLVVIFM